MQLIFSYKRQKQFLSKKHFSQLLNIPKNVY